jgi:hypothetical protein
MLQRAFYLLFKDLELDALFRLNEQQMIGQLRQAAGNSPAGDLLDGLFGPSRQLYKRLAEYSFFQNREIYQQLARRPYPWLAACGEALANVLSPRIRRRVAPHEILFDAPPIQREVEFNIDVFFPKEACYRALAEVSPVVHTLARKQFDDYVKRVRIFVHSRLLEDITRLGDLEPSLNEAIAQMQ